MKVLSVLSFVIGISLVACTECDLEQLNKDHLMALEKIKRHDYMNALPILLKVRKCNISDSLEYDIGCCYLFNTREGSRDSAIYYFKSALKVNPEHKNAMFNLGVTYSLSDTTCKNGLDMLLELYRKDSTCHGIELAIANAYDCLHMPAEALMFRNRFIEKNGADPNFIKDRAANYLQLNELDKAINDYTTVLEFWPNDAESYYRRGSAKLKLGDTLAACEDFKVATEMDYKKAIESLEKYCK